MKKDTYLRNVFRTLFSHKGRFFGNFAVSFLALLITTGLGVLPNGTGESYAKTFENNLTPDLILTSKAKTGFSQEEIDKVLIYPGLDAAETLFTMDTELNGEYYRFYIRDFEHGTLDIPTLKQGRMPLGRGEVIALEGNNVRAKRSVGDKFTFDSMGLFGLNDITVTGVATSPLYTHAGGNRVRLEDQSNKSNVVAVFYADFRYVYSFLDHWRTDIYVRFKGDHAYLTESYHKTMDERKAEMLTYLGGEDNVAVLTLQENESYAFFSKTSEKIRIIGYVFPFFFLLVGALMNSITVSRLVQDERLQIGSYVALGEPKSWILGKYTSFSCISVGLGAIVGYFVGVTTLPVLILPAFEAVFSLNGMVWELFSMLGIIMAAALFVATFIMTFLTIRAHMKETPASLLREKAPKAGRRILLERIGFIWRPLSFSIKSMFRNIFRQRKNFWLTSLSVGGSTLLVFLGFSLLNVSNAMLEDELFKTVASSMGAISTAIIFIAMAMDVAIVYLLANMNIQERKREIATLKVLGYTTRQCCMYCFREILFIAILASIVSLPIDAVVNHILLRYLDFGSISDVQWWSYVLSVAVVTVSTVLVNLLLIHRVKQINTTTSLAAE